jgi:homoserine kinase
MPDSLALVRALREKGVPAVLSGAGPSVLAFVDGHASSAVQVHCPEGWQVLDLAVDAAGVEVRAAG